MSLESIIDLALSEDGLDELFGGGSYEEYDYESEYDFDNFEYYHDAEYGEDYDL